MKAGKESKPSSPCQKENYVSERPEGIGALGNEILFAWARRNGKLLEREFEGLFCGCQISAGELKARL